MRNFSRKQKLLIGISPVLCITMLFVIPFLTDKFGKTAGYLSGFCVYWFIFCLPILLYISGNAKGIKAIYMQKANISQISRKLYYLLAFLPCLATFFAVFLNTAPKIEFSVLALILAFAIINATIEEAFWRGSYNKMFTNNICFAYFYPTTLFGIWHIALYFAKGIEYQGGFASLVGGSFFMGMLWGWVAYKTKSIKVVTLAHIITNFFAFTGLIYGNWII